MRHLTSGRQFSANTSHRRAMFRNMAINLFRYERIKTTDPKAKELRKFAEKLITWGKRGDLHSRRLARTFIQDKEILKKLFTELKDRFAKRKGGYTRIMKLNPRLGDAASMALIELIPDLKAKAKRDEAKKDKKKEKDAKAKEAAEPKAEKEAKPAKEEKTDPEISKKALDPKAK